ncbi:MAG TPA: GDP-mannose 4,6-dehydratase [Polyangiaceae bacterium]
MKIILTGGAGFIGCNAASRFLKQGHQVVVIDDLSRRGTDKNLAWLRTQGSFEFSQTDIRSADKLAAAVGAHPDTAVVLHLAAQVAVTTSVVDPRTDFEINALGTFNLLEAVRKHCPKAFVIYASTNKVYGGLEHLKVTEVGGRYQLGECPHGVAETEPLDFHSPYGCSKGAADQYVIDYSRIYGLKSVALRQSCIYGYRQFGIEDQGWVAWFTIAALLGRPITIYGDGKQVRDVLFVEDLCELYEACIQHADRVSGKAYNVGGGPENQLSLRELLADLERRLKVSLKPTFTATRPGDQPVFVADIRKAERDLGWRPRTSAADGVAKLVDWVGANRTLFES